MSTYFCRICVEPCDSETSSMFTRSITEMLSSCIAEFDVKLVNNPIVCEACHRFVKEMYEFKSKCLNIQDQIVELMANNNGTSVLFDLKSLSEKVTVNNGRGASMTNTTKCKKDLNSICGTPKSNRNNGLDIDHKNISPVLKKPKLKEHDPTEELLELLISSSNTKYVSEGQSDSMIQNKTISNDRDIPEEHNNDSIKKNTTLLNDKNISLSSSNELKSPSKASQVTQEVKGKQKTVKKILTTTSRSRLKVGQKFLGFCKECDQKFPTATSLVSHLYGTGHSSSNNNRALFQCFHCAYKGSKIRYLLNHYNEVHPGIVNFHATCMFCINSNCLSEQGLLQHIICKHANIYENNTFKCKKCAFTSSYYEDFKSHYFSVHDLTCNICENDSSSIVSLNRHIAHHRAHSKTQTLTKMRNKYPLAKKKGSIVKKKETGKKKLSEVKRKIPEIKKVHPVVKIKFIETEKKPTENKQIPREIKTNFPKIEEKLLQIKEEIIDQNHIV